MGVSTSSLSPCAHITLCIGANPIIPTMNKEPPLIWRIYKCFRNPKQWIERIKIDMACLVLIRQNNDLGWQLREVSDKLWDEFYAQY